MAKRGIGSRAYGSTNTTVLRGGMLKLPATLSKLALRGRASPVDAC